MISVGINVSKEKSTIYILKPYGEIVSRSFEVFHTEKTAREEELEVEKMQEAESPETA